MVRPFADFDDYKEKEDAKRSVHYSQKMLKVVIDALMPEEALKLRREAGDEFGFRWFNDSCSSRLAIALDAMNRPVQVADLLKTGGVTKTALWQHYFDLRSEYGSPFGLIFLVPGLSQWIMHDTQLPYEPGYAYITRISAKEDAQLTVQPLVAFLASVKRA